MVRLAQLFCTPSFLDYLDAKKLDYGFAAIFFDVKATLYSRQFELLEIKIKSCHR
jgi:hypothetical protein